MVHVHIVALMVLFLTYYTEELDILAVEWNGVAEDVTQ
jgi:hypothetical protein